MCDGVPTASEVVYWSKTLATPSTLPPPRQDKYLTFEYDAGGWNNIRMGLECLVVLGHVLRRTVVLPPPQPLYLIANNYHQRRDFGFADFLNVTLLGSHSGWRTLSMDQFLSSKIKGAPITAKGRSIWKAVSQASDATLPPRRAALRHLLCARERCSRVMEEHELSAGPEGRQAR